MTTTASNVSPGLLSRISAFFATIVDVIREARQMRATFGSHYGE